MPLATHTLRGRTQKRHVHEPPWLARGKQNKRDSDEKQHCSTVSNLRNKLRAQFFVERLFVGRSHNEKAASLDFSSKPVPELPTKVPTEQFVILMCLNESRFKKILI